MDPEEALKQLREFSKIILENPSENDSVSVEMADRFQTLDEWLSNGGFLPKDWKK